MANACTRSPRWAAEPSRGGSRRRDGAGGRGASDGAGAARRGRGRAHGVERGIDAVLAIQRPVVVAHLRSIRRRSPNATPDQIVRILERRYLAAVTTGGAAVGATAVIPGIGTGVDARALRRRDGRIPRGHRAVRAVRRRGARHRHRQPRPRPCARDDAHARPRGHRPRAPVRRAGLRRRHRPQRLLGRAHHQHACRRRSWAPSSTGCDTCSSGSSRCAAAPASSARRSRSASARRSAARATTSSAAGCCGSPGSRSARRRRCCRTSSSHASAIRSCSRPRRG